MTQCHYYTSHRVVQVTITNVTMAADIDFYTVHLNGATLKDPIKVSAMSESLVAVFYLGNVEVHDITHVAIELTATNKCGQESSSLSLKCESSSSTPECDSSGRVTGIYGDNYICVHEYFLVQVDPSSSINSERNVYISPSCMQLDCFGNLFSLTLLFYIHINISMHQPPLHYNVSRKCSQTYTWVKPTIILHV